METCTELATAGARDEMLANQEITFEDEMYKQGEEGDDTLYFTEKAQDYFNHWYDYIEGEILKHEVK